MSMDACYTEEMISQYALHETAKLQDRFLLAQGLPKGVKPNGAVGPTMTAPVVVSRDGQARVELMKWGLVAKGAKDTNSVFRYKTYNVPSEKVLSRHSWETAVRQSRCLVPVNGFYVPASDQDKKRMQYVQLPDQSLFALAGIATTWEDPQGVAWGTFAILTIEGDRAIAPVDGRMPVILSRDDEARWLDAQMVDANALYGLMRAYPQDMLRIESASLDTI